MAGRAEATFIRSTALSEAVQHNFAILYTFPRITGQHVAAATVSIRRSFPEMELRQSKSK